MKRPEAIRRIEEASVAHFATVRPDGSPHIVPVTFATLGGRLAHMIDHKPKTTRRLQRLRNIEETPRATLLVDHYDDDWDRLWWVRVDGPVTVAGEGSEWAAARHVLMEKYPQYEGNPPQGPAIILEMESVSGWEATPSPPPR